MGKTADAGVKAANKVEQTRAEGTTETSETQSAAAEAAAPQTIGAGVNVAPANTTNVAPAAASADFF